jgi:hypothetical protein
MSEQVAVITVGPDANGEFPAEVVALVKSQGKTALDEAVKVAESFSMPLVAVFVFENNKVCHGQHAAFAATNAPLEVTDSMLTVGMNQLAALQEADGPAH